MKLAPTNFSGKAVVMTHRKNHKHGMEQYIKFGDIDDPKAMNIFVEGDHVYNADIPYNILDAFEHKTRDCGMIFFTKLPNIKHQKFTVLENGMISLDIDPQYVMGTDEG